MVTICLFQCFYLRREYVWLVTCLFVSQTALFMHHLSIIKEFRSEISFADWRISCKFVLLARNCVLTNHAAPAETGLRVVGVCPAVVWSPHTATCRAAPWVPALCALRRLQRLQCPRNQQGSRVCCPGIIRTFSCSGILATQLWGHLASKQMSFLTTFENVDWPANVSC